MASTVSAWPGASAARGHGKVRTIGITWCAICKLPASPANGSTPEGPAVALVGSGRPTSYTGSRAVFCWGNYAPSACIEKSYRVVYHHRQTGARFDWLAEP